MLAGKRNQCGKSLRAFLVVSFLVIFFSCIFAQGGEIDAQALNALIKGSSKKVSDHCEITQGRSVRVRDFLDSYVKWSALARKRNPKAKQYFSCSEIPEKKSIYQCHLGYSEPKLRNIHPGWNMDLEFEFQLGKGILWKTASCVSTP